VHAKRARRGGGDDERARERQERSKEEREAAGHLGCSCVGLGVAEGPALVTTQRGGAVGACVGDELGGDVVGILCDATLGGADATLAGAGVAASLRLITAWSSISVIFLFDSSSFSSNSLTSA